MKKRQKGDEKDELLPEYDLKALMKGGVRGKYAARYRAGTNAVLLQPDVRKAFPTSESVNDALRLAMKMAEIQSSGRTGAVKR